MKSRRWRIGNGRRLIKVVFCCCLLFTIHYSLFTVFSFAEDTIRVLMLENLNEPILTEDAQNVGSLNGKVSTTNGQVYKGLIEVRKDKNGLHFINEIPFEKYVEGVVAGEIGKKWDIEALKVQAVIARTYAAYYKDINTGKDYHLTSTVLNQVYKENTDPWVAMAVKETEGEILTYEGRPIEAFYHSTCGGKTELPEEVWGKKKSHPYLRSVVCIDKSSPYHEWKKKFNFEEIEKALGIKGIKDISVASFTSTGRVKTLKIRAEDSTTTKLEGVKPVKAGEIEVNAVDLRRLLGYKELPSTLFTTNVAEREIIFVGKGYGHGVGLCQWCALEMAKQGKTYKEILEYYYPGTILEKRK